jgi:predicted RNA binding protein YcfA (HicA-like mRNA interferase family)
MKIRDVIKMIEQDGWRKISQEGSHRHYKHPMKPGKVTVADIPRTMSRRERLTTFESRQV